MILNADDYRNNVNNIKYLTRDKKLSDLVKYAPALAISTSVHIVIVYVYLCELYGFSEELVSNMERLKEYYSVTEVKGVKHV